jgi:hypothetical protein
MASPIRFARAGRIFAPAIFPAPRNADEASPCALGSELHFVRLTTRGLPPRTVRLAVIR